LIKGRLVNAYYRKKGDDFKLYFVLRARCENGIEKIVIPWTSEFKPYFFCTRKALPFIKKCFEKLEYAGYNISIDNDVKIMQRNDETVYKVEVNNPDIIFSLKQLNLYKNNPYYNDNEIFEMMNFTLQYLINKNLGSWLMFDLKNKEIYNWDEPDYDLQPKNLYYDLESDMEGSKRILCFSYGTTEENVQNFMGSEKQIFGKIKELMQEYDNFISWSDYDSKKLKYRASKLKIKMNWNLINFVDQMFIMTKTHPSYTGKQYLAIDDVGAELCNRQKKRMPKGLMYYYHNELDDFIEYNNEDVRLQIAIEQASGNVAGWCYAVEHLGFPLSFARYISMLPKVAWLKKAQHHRKIREIIPNSKIKGENKNYLGAGVTKNPRVGIFKNIFAMDLKGSYVSIIGDYNISPEVWNPETGKFDKGYGIFAELIHEATELRDKFKKLRKEQPYKSKLYNRYDAMQYGMKVISLTFYGECGRGKSPFFILDVAQFITDRGREHIERCEATLDNKFDVTRIYKDTDSIYWVFNWDNGDFEWDKPSVKRMFNQVLSTINDDLALLMDSKGIPENRRTIEMEAQAFYTRGLWAGIAKHYTYYEQYTADTNEWHDKPKFGVKGWVKSVNGKLALENQHKIAKMLMDEESLDDIINYLKELKNEVLAGKHDSKLILKKGMTKTFKEYEKKGSMNYILNAAKKAYEKGRYIEQTTINYVIVEETRKEKIAELVFEGEIPEIKKSGYICMWNDFVFKSVLAVLKATGKPEKLIKRKMDSGIISLLDF